MSWIEKLQTRWKIGSSKQVIIILIVFALTGTTVVLIKKPLLQFLFGVEIPLWARIVYYILILPFYNLVLLFYGFIFGQYQFFIDFEKRTWKRITSRFAKKDTN